MSRRANPRLIGAFVLGAIGLMVAAALIFGSFTFFETTRRFVVYFEGSVDGLTAGSPVLFRGVPLGKVVEVGILYNSKKNTFKIPVIIEIRPGVIARFSPPVTTNTKLMQQLVDNGLRARLESASLVTGQQVVQLNFFPGTPIKLVSSDLPFYQLPTVPSQTQQLMSSVDAASKNLPALIQSAAQTLERIQAMVSPENRKALTTLLESAAATMNNLQTASASLGPLVGHADNAVAGVGKLSANLNSVVQDNRQDIRVVLANFRDATVSLRKLLDQVNGIAADNRAPLRRFTDASLPDLTGLIIDARLAVDRASTVLDSIERNPTRFLFGNKMGQGVEVK